MGSALSGNPGDVPLVFRDPCVQHTIRESWGCPGIKGSIGPGSSQDGLYILDILGCLRKQCGSTGHPSSWHL